MRLAFPQEALSRVGEGGKNGSPLTRLRLNSPSAFAKAMADKLAH